MSAGTVGPRRGGRRILMAGGRGRQRQRNSYRSLLFIVPSAALIGLFSYYPAVSSFVYSLTNWDGFNPPKFTGLKNYEQYLTSSTLGSQLENMLILFVGGILLYLIFPFIGAQVAAHLRKPRWAAGAFKYLIVLPMAVPGVVVINVWAFILNPLTGPVDAFTQAIGLGQPQWFGDPHLALLGILTIGFPWISGLAFLVLLAGIQNIPVEIIEATELDGTRWFRRMVKIEIPLIIPEIRLVTIINGIAMIQNFIAILLLTNGGPGNSTMVPGLAMYQAAFTNSEYGSAMAIGTLLFLTLVVFSFVVARVLRPRT